VSTDNAPADGPMSQFAAGLLENAPIGRDAYSRWLGFTSTEVVYGVTGT
jgi:hypothetical protein